MGGDCTSFGCHIPVERAQVSLPTAMATSKDPETLRAASLPEKQPLVGGSKNQRHYETESLWSNARDTVSLAVPMFLANLSWVGMKTTDSALLGHVSSDALSAAALSDLWTMCTFALVSTRILGVLNSAAIGAGNPKLAGRYLQVAYFVLSFVIAFVVVCWMVTEQVWTMLGSDVQLAKMAGFYARVLALSLPGQVALGQLGQFFTSQRIMHPGVTASSIALMLNLVLGLILVLGIPIPGWNGLGFVACPIVTVAVIYIQFLIIYVVYVRIQRLHEACWDGWAWREITTARIRMFCDLYIPAALANSSDFLRVAVIGAVAARLGNVEVAVFNTGYRVMWIVLTLIGAVSSASGIKTSQRLGKMDHIGAKQAGWVGIYLSMAVLAVIEVFVLWKVRWFGKIFSDDKEFLDLFEEVKWPFTLTLVLMNLSFAIERIPFSMGRSREVFWYGLVASWGAQVPAVVLLTSFWRNDLVGLYWGMTIGYAVLTLLYGWMVVKSDWVHYAVLARQRSEMSDD